MIVIAGATGYTGTLISHELYKMGVRPILAGRDSLKLTKLVQDVCGKDDCGSVASQQTEGSLSTEVLDITDPESVSRALSDASVVINCAGPFMDLGEPVLKEAVRRGVHYLDTTGEQPFIRIALEKYGKIASRSGNGKAGSAVIPACAFEYALGDAAAALAAQTIEPCERIELTYWIDGFGASRGTKKSVLRMMSEPGYQRRGKEPVESNLAADHRKIGVPDQGILGAYSMPGGEVFMVPLHVAVDDLTTYMVMPAPRAVLRLASSFGPVLGWPPIARFLSNRLDRGQFGPSAEDRRRTRFLIVCSATGSKGTTRTVIVQGSDPYGLTANIAAGIAFLIDSGKVRPAGAVSPSMVAGHQTIVDITSEAGVSWSVSGGEK
jgi:short subunit dehydrogenase-like uncharacterized protein